MFQIKIALDAPGCCTLKFYSDVESRFLIVMIASLKRSPVDQRHGNFSSQMI